MPARAALLLAVVVAAACAPAPPSPPPAPSPSAAPTAPSARALAALAQDPATGDLVLFGGRSGSGASLTDTWLRRNDRWTAGPTATPVSGALLVQEPDMSGVLLVGHDLRGGYIAAQPVGLLTTWLWHAGAWTEQHPDEQPPGTLEPFGIAWSPSRHAVFMLGDDVHGLARRPQLWRWDGHTWFRPWQGAIGDDLGKVAMRLALAPDGTVEALNADDTGHLRLERFDTDHWTVIPTAGGGPSDAAAVATLDTTRLVLSAGGSAGLVTWILEGTTWRQAAGAPQPALRDGFGTAPASTAALLFGGAAPGNDQTVYGDLWRFHTAWSRLSA